MKDEKEQVLWLSGYRMLPKTNDDPEDIRFTKDDQLEVATFVKINGKVTWNYFDNILTAKAVYITAVAFMVPIILCVENEQFLGKSSS